MTTIKLVWTVHEIKTVTLNDGEYKEFKKMSKDQKKNYISENSDGSEYEGTSQYKIEVVP